MPLIETQSFSISCPCCGETIEVLVDPSVEQQSYVEDCQVCCRPMNMTVTVDDSGFAHVHAQSEDEI